MLFSGRVSGQFSHSPADKSIDSIFILCLVGREEFDMEKAKPVAAMLIGKHDFRTFMGTNNEEKTVGS